MFSLTPIGHIKSVFKSKNGTPRQSGLSPSARASLTLSKAFFTNPEHALENLSEFSHVWIIWMFHANDSPGLKAKVSPPRLKGERVGVYSTRSPHRPNPIGLTLATLESVIGDTVFLSGVDMIEGTPVLDIKPYIPQYDSITQQGSPVVITEGSGGDSGGLSGQVGERVDTVESETAENAETARQSDSETQDFQSHKREKESCDKRTSDTAEKCVPGVSEPEATVPSVETEVRVPEWIGNPEENLAVQFSTRADQDLSSIRLNELQWLKSREELANVIRDVLSSDPRSVYRRNKCSDRLYFTQIDGVHITAWFDNRFDLMEVLSLRQLTNPERAASM